MNVLKKKIIKDITQQLLLYGNNIDMGPICSFSYSVISYLLSFNTKIFC